MCMPSQYEEDEILRHILPLTPKGLYVDIGANQPWLHSNTAQYYKNGWSGLLVEVNPTLCELLIDERPNDLVYQCAASNRNGIATLKLDTSEFSSLSSLQPDWHIENYTEIQVNVELTSTILDKYCDIRDNALLCSIDVEGHEKSVLQGIDFSCFRPKVFIIESIGHKTGKQLWKEWEPILVDNGYTFNTKTRNGLNRIYTLNV